MRAPRARAAPPLREPGHVHVVPGHLGVQAEDLPAVPAQSQAELGLFAGDDRRVVARRAAEGRRPDHRVAAAGVGLADRRVPLEVGQAVVDRLVAVPLAAAAGDDGDVRPSREGRDGPLQPAGRHLAVAVDELDQRDLRGDVLQPLEAGVARPGRRERDREVQLDDLRPQRPGQLDAAVGRARIDVDDRAGPGR